MIQLWLAECFCMFNIDRSHLLNDDDDCGIIDYTVQLQLRLCRLETSSAQSDSFPSDVSIYVNGAICPLQVIYRFLLSRCAVIDGRISDVWVCDCETYTRLLIVQYLLSTVLYTLHRSIKIFFATNRSLDGRMSQSVVNRHWMTILITAKCLVLLRRQKVILNHKQAKHCMIFSFVN